jgi:hypothetical protein
MSKRLLLLIVAALFIEAALIHWSGPFAGMLIPLIGFVLNIVFVVLKVGRTGALTTWTLRKHDSTPAERQLQIAGLSLLGGSILLLWILGSARTEG